MSEPTVVPAPGAQTTEPQQQAQPNQPGEPAAVEPLGAGGIKALQAERDARAAAEKAAADLQAQLDKIAEANLSELEKAQKDAKDASEAAATARTEALRYRLAASHGISTAPGENGEPSDAEVFLTAADEAGMTAQAQRFAARTAPQESAPTFPRPDLTQGSGRDTANASNAGTDFQKFLNGQLGG